MADAVGHLASPGHPRTNARLYPVPICGLLSIRVGGACGEGQTPAMGLRQGCPLSATLFGLFIGGLSHHLESMLPLAGIGLCGTRLRELVYADDICLLATSPAELQALIDALAI